MRSKSYDIIDYLWSIVRTQPLEASFFAYFDPKKRRYYQDVLHLICCPAHLRKEVKEEILDETGKEGSFNEVSSKRLMVPDRDKAFVSVSGGINTLEDREDFYLRFVQTFSRAKKNGSMLRVATWYRIKICYNWLPEA